jgi:hypothetical protein
MLTAWGGGGGRIRERGSPTLTFGTESGTRGVNCGDANPCRSCVLSG